MIILDYFKRQKKVGVVFFFLHMYKIILHLFIIKKIFVHE